MPAPWTRVFADPTFRALIANMTDAERLRTLGRLREAIAKCPDSLSLPTGSFWAHMRSCPAAEWRRTVNRIDQVLSASALAALPPALGIFPHWQAGGLTSARLVPRCSSAASTPPP